MPEEGQEENKKVKYMKNTHRLLKELLSERVDWVLDIGTIDKNIKPANTNKEDVIKLITLAKREIEEANYNLARTEFAKIIENRHQFAVKSNFNPHQLKINLLEWAADNGINKNLIYIFWRNSTEAVYIGRSAFGTKSAADHLTRHWINEVCKIDIYTLGNKRNLAKAECLAAHIYPSVKNITRPGRIIYTAVCPVCHQIKMFCKEVRLLLG